MPSRYHQNTLMARLNTIILLLLFYSISQVASVEYYITANSTDLCTSSCLTLNEFVANFRDLFTPNITVVFSPGVHYLNGSLNVSYSSAFFMTSESIPAQIRCASYSRIVFNCSQNIFITNLEFIGYGGNQLLRVQKFVARNATFRGQGKSGTALQLIETRAQITNSTFLSNRNGQVKFYSGLFGGAIIATNSDIDISQSIFENNGAQHSNGGAIYAEQQNTININTSRLINNSALFGILYLNGSNIMIEQSIFEQNTGDIATIALWPQQC